MQQEHEVIEQGVFIYKKKDVFAMTGCSQSRLNQYRLGRENKRKDGTVIYTEQAILHEHVHYVYVLSNNRVTVLYSIQAIEAIQAKLNKLVTIDHLEV